MRDIHHYSSTATRYLPCTILVPSCTNGSVKGHQDPQLIIPTGPRPHGRARYPSRRLRGAATLQGILRAVPHSGAKLGARAGSGLQENRGQPGWYGSCLKKMGKHGTTLKSGCFEHRFHMFSPFNSHLMLFEAIIRTFSDIPIRVWTHGVVFIADKYSIVNWFWDLTPSGEEKVPFADDRQG